jgi:transcriptional regulator with XRE-family HTH domain
MPRQKNERIIDNETIGIIGKTLSGTHWQSEIARDLSYSKSFITRASRGARSPDVKFLEGLRGLMIDKVDELGKLFNSDGLPFDDTPQTKQAQKLIAEAVKLLRKQKMPVKRVES